MLSSKLVVVLAYVLQKHFNCDLANKVIEDNFIDEYGTKASYQSIGQKFFKAQSLIETFLKVSSEELGIDTAGYDVIVGVNDNYGIITIKDHGSLVLEQVIRIEWYPSIIELKKFLLLAYRDFRRSIAVLRAA